MEWFLTWLWHGVALAVLVSAALRAGGRATASARYLVWWAALAGVMALGWTALPGPAVPVGRAVQGAGSPPELFVLTLPPEPAWLIVTLVGAWLVLTAAGLGRLAAAMARLRSERRRCRPIPVSRERRLPMWLSVRSTGRRARLMVSESTAVASVLGFVRPVIVLPRRLLARVTDHELDQIVMHEHAHVQRWDDWTRLAQTVVEAVCLTHPAVRWIGQSIDLEREMACDDRVVARTGAPRAYAGCLARVAEWAAAHPAPTVAPGMHGAARTLVPRVERLLAPRPYAGRVVSAATVAAGMVLVAAAVLQLRVLPSLVVEQVAVTTPAVGEPAVVASLAAGLGLRPDWDSLPSARPAARAVVAARIPSPAPVEASREAAEPLLAATWLTAPVGLAVESISPGEIDLVDDPGLAGLVDDPGLAGNDRVDSGVVDSRSPWRKAADAGLAIGAGARKTGLALASTYTRLGRSIGRAF